MLINTCLANAKQRYISSFSARSNPSSHSILTENHFLSKSHFLHFGNSAKNLQSIRACFGLFISCQHFWSILNPLLVTVSKDSPAAISKLINGKIRMELFQRFLSLKPSSIHLLGAVRVPVSSQNNKITTASSLCSEFGKNSIFTILKTMLCFR